MRRSKGVRRSARTAGTTSLQPRPLPSPLSREVAVPDQSDNGDTVTISKRTIWIVLGLVVAAGVAVAIVLAVNSGGDSNKVTTQSSVGSSQTEDVTTNPGITSTPPQVDPSEWLTLWCQATTDMTRDALWQLMGMPTAPDSGVIPLIPSGTQPPSPNGSDTWQAAGTYQFNAFYSTKLTVQQLDFNGPDNKLGCENPRT